jgi:hypothetical protein
MTVSLTAEFNPYIKDNVQQEGEQMYAVVYQQDISDIYYNNNLLEDSAKSNFAYLLLIIFVHLVN